MWAEKNRTFKYNVSIELLQFTTNPEAHLKFYRAITFKNVTNT